MIRQHPDLAFAAAFIGCTLTSAICAKLGLSWPETLGAVIALLSLAGAAAFALRSGL